MATQHHMKNWRIALIVAAFAFTTSASAADAPAVEAPTWRMEATDGTLKGALQRWSQAAGWQLVWELPVDFAVEARAQVPGAFEDAVAAVMRSMEQSEMPMKAVFYRGNKVLRVIAKGAQ